MYRIDNSTALPTLPTPAAIGVNPNGYFFKGDPTLATPATIVDDDWCNSIQEELCSIVADMSITLDKTKYDQVLKSIKALIQSNKVNYCTSTSSANTYVATLNPAPAALIAGNVFVVKFTNHNTNASTINFNTLGAKSILRRDGAQIASGDIYDGMMGVLAYDGAAFQLLNPNNYLDLYCVDSGSVNAYIGTLSPVPASYYDGMRIGIKIGAGNTGAATVNFNGIGVVNILRGDGTSLRTGDMASGMIAVLFYNTSTGSFQLINPCISVPQTNIAINSNFTIWQAQTNFISPANGAYDADMWSWAASGVGTVTISRSTDVPTVVQSGALFVYSGKMVVTAVDASIAAGDVYARAYKMEGYDVAKIAQRAFTVSFWVKSHKTGIFCFAMVNGGADRSYVKEYTINSADTWEFKTITIPASPSAGTWNYTNGLGATFYFTQACGATYQTSDATWATGNYLGTLNQVNNLDSTSNTFLIDGFKVEPGNIATTYIVETTPEIIAKCQRYYRKSYNIGDFPGTVTDNSTNAQYIWSNVNNVGGGWGINFYPAMRTTPTVTIYAPKTGDAGYVSDNVTNVDYLCDVVNIGETSSTVRNQYGALATAKGISWHWVNNSRL